jgi:hypothetical protein
MQLTDSDFLNQWAEPPGAEYQLLQDFESEIQDEGKFANLDFLTKEIKRGFLDYVWQGIMLHTIRRFRLYKDKFKDFKIYCEQGLGRQHFYCKQIIKAADICLRLIIKSGFKIWRCTRGSMLSIARPQGTNIFQLVIGTVLCFK